MAGRSRHSASQSAGHDRRQARAHHRRARPLLFHRRPDRHVRHARRPYPQREGGQGAFHPRRRQGRRGGPVQGHGQDGHRPGGAVDQPVLVPRRPRPVAKGGGDPQRTPGRTDPRLSRPLRRLLRPVLAASRPGRDRARGRHPQQGSEGRGHRRPCRGYGVRRPQAAPGVGQGAGPGRGAVHPSAEPAGTGQATDATVGWPTPSAIRWIPPSPSST